MKGPRLFGTPSLGRTNWPLSCEPCKTSRNENERSQRRGENDESNLKCGV